jgi:hypothetical protein
MSLFLKPMATCSVAWFCQQDLELEEFRALEREILKGVNLPKKAPAQNQRQGEVCQLHSITGVVCYSSMLW